MKSNNSIFDHETAKYTCLAPAKEEAYKNHRLLSKIAHLGVGGNPWLTSVLDATGCVVANFAADSRLETTDEAKAWVDSNTNQAH